MYSTIVPMLAYAAVVQLSTKHSWRPIVSSLTVVAIHTGYILAIRFIMQTGFGGGIAGIFGLRDLLMAVAQLAVGYVVFRLLERYEETYLAWFFIAIGGAVALFAVIPAVIPNF